MVLKSNKNNEFTVKCLTLGVADMKSRVTDEWWYSRLRLCDIPASLQMSGESKTCQNNRKKNVISVQSIVFKVDETEYDTLAFPGPLGV